jgi:hypothetical protein
VRLVEPRAPEGGVPDHVHADAKPNAAAADDADDADEDAGDVDDVHDAENAAENAEHAEDDAEHAEDDAEDNAPTTSPRTARLGPSERVTCPSLTAAGAASPTSSAAVRRMPPTSCHEVTGMSSFAASSARHSSS